MTGRMRLTNLLSDNNKKRTLFIIRQERESNKKKIRHFIYKDVYQVNSFSFPLKLPGRGCVLF